MGADVDGASAARRAAAEEATRQAVEAAAQRLADSVRRSAAAGSASPVVEPVVEPVGVAEPIPVEGELGEGEPGEPAGGRAHMPEPKTDPLWEAIGGFAGGLGAAALGLGGGLAFLATHPLEAARGVATLATRPDRLAAAGGMIWDEARAGGWAHAAGYVAGSAAPLLLGPGGAIAVAAMAAEKLAAEPPP